MSIPTRQLLSGGADFARIFVNLATKELREMGVLLHYAYNVKSRTKRTPMKDVDGLVKLWVDVFAGCCTAHDKADFDAADFQHDEMLTPILSAPIAELREFGEKLCVALEADPRIPYIVWRPFVETLRKSLEKMTKEKVYVLKEKLAREIAVAVEEGVKPQILDAIANALKWRDETTLEKVKTAVKDGAEPKLVGRQSCLFLKVGNETVML